MGRRRNEDKPGHARRKIQREGKRQRTAPGMADNNGAIDAKPAGLLATRAVGCTPYLRRLILLSW